mmetsp:Transcript_21671/g.19216  ORF Transcript_21671/g.19216 Transcript_21671/m.19216 type:complete len:104 (+) Transcript_21671:150-461(+)
MISKLENFKVSDSPFRIIKKNYRLRRLETSVEGDILTLNIKVELSVTKRKKLTNQKKEPREKTEEDKYECEDQKDSVKLLNSYPHEISYVPSMGPKRSKRIIH